MNKKYTVSHFESYHSGKMPLQEMYALEKAALEDPFLADALEGYEHTSSGEADVAELKKRLFQNTKKKKIAPIYLLTKNTWWRVAALVILIAGAGLIFYKINPSGNKNDLAQNEVPSVKNADDNYALPKIDSDNAQADMAFHDNSGSKDAAINAPQSPNANVKKEEQNSPIIAETAPSPRLEQSANILSDKKEIDDKAASGYLKGKMTDEERKTFTPKTEKQRNTDAIDFTDTTGKVFLKPQDSDAYAVVSTEAVSKKVILKKNAHSARRKVQNDSALEEKILLTERQAEKSASKAFGIQKNSQLLSGNKAFDEYLIKNLKPVYDKDSVRQKGEVLLSFKINKIGEPINIEVQKSTCKSCEIQAKKLLEEGPKWKVEHIVKTLLINFY